MDEKKKRKSTTTTTNKQKQQTQQQRNKKTQEFEAKQPDQANIMKMFKKMEEAKQQHRPEVNVAQQQTTASGKECEQQRQPVRLKTSGPQQQTPTEEQQQNPTEATRSRKTTLEQQHRD